MTTPVLEREFAYTADDFQALRGLALQHAGITLADSKSDMVYARLARRIRQLGLPDVASYVARVARGEPDEVRSFVNAMTTNLTAFFREGHHFAHLAEEVLPALLPAGAGPRRIRIWSAACSTGEEPYSIAITLARALPPERAPDVRVLATDIDSQVLEHARAGIYDAERVQRLPAAVRAAGFQRGRGAQEGKVRVRPAIAERITFRRLNLMEPWPMQGPFDVVFCRNVIIYFDKATQRRLFDRMADLMAPGATLYLGHSESLHQVSDRFAPVGRTIYRRVP